ncbi:sulfotransferase domain-containing protein [Candidatus Nitrosopelagicus sp.]|nr:sulfotransferase domain-containing protein [Candidatus Nitrosopelagicus sp.]
MRVECHNQDCKNIFNFTGESNFVNCPLCSSRIPLSKITNKELIEIQKNNSNPRSIKNRTRIWLINHKSINPYNFFNKPEYNKSENTINPYSPFRQLTGKFRTLPNFIFFGGTRSGVMTLTKYVDEHPDVETVRNIHFFEYVYSNKINWYKRHFPTRIYKKFFNLKHNRELLIGESTGTYFFHEQVPKRIKEHLPDVKLILMLKNPVTSSYSRYNHYKNQGLEPCSFDDVIDMELKRIEILQNNNQLQINNPDLSHYITCNYLRHGHYAEKLKAWFNEFPREQILILTNDEFNSRMDETLTKTFEFLGLTDFHVKNKIAHNVGKYKKMNEKTKQKLINYFKPYNQELYKILGKDLNWENI